MGRREGILFGAMGILKGKVCDDSRRGDVDDDTKEWAERAGSRIEEIQGAS